MKTASFGCSLVAGCGAEALLLRLELIEPQHDLEWVLGLWLKRDFNGDEGGRRVDGGGVIDGHDCAQVPYQRRPPQLELSAMSASIIRQVVSGHVPPCW